MKINNYVELLEVLKSNEKEIILQNSMSVPSGITLNPGQRLYGKGDNILLSFINGDGIALTGDNIIENVSIQTSPSHRAIYLQSPHEDLGEIVLNNLTVTGVVQLITRGNNQKLSIFIDGLDIVAADARSFSERPMKYGVIVYQGALTIYNFNPKDGSEINVKAENVSVGRENAPVLGSGIFISGFSDDAGKIIIKNSLPMISIQMG